MNKVLQIRSSATTRHKQSSMLTPIIAVTPAAWSRGMIPALGAGGLGFNSRSGPSFLFSPFELWAQTFMSSLCP
jgi:hypothetical protein